MDTETDAAVLLEWLNSNECGPERALQATAADHLCMAILMTENVDRCLQKYAPRLFIPALLHLFLDANAPDTLLEVTSRAITYFLDLSNDCIQRLIAVPHGLEALSSRLLPKDIDERISRELSEQIVKIFEKVSHIRVPTEATDNLFILLAKYANRLHNDTVKSALVVFKSLCTDRSCCAKLARYDLSPLTQSQIPIITQKVIECLPILIENGAPIPRPVPEALSSQPDILSRIVHDRLDIEPRLLFGVEGTPLDHRLADSIVGIVFEQYRRPQHSTSPSTWTDVHELLVQAIMNGNSDLSRFKNNSDICEQVNALNEHRDSLLSWAAAFGTEYHVEYLLSVGANPRFGKKGSALHCAAYTNNKAVYRTLLQLGASPDTVDSRGMTPSESAMTLRTESSSQLFQESVIYFEPRKSHLPMSYDQCTDIVNRLMEVQSTTARGLRIFRRVFANLSEDSLLIILDGPLGRQIQSDIVQLIKKQNDDPEAFYTCLRLIEDLFALSPHRFLPRLSRVGIISKLGELYSELNIGASQEQQATIPANFQTTSITQTPLAPITSGPYVYGNWRIVESGSHVIVWHKNLQLAFDIWKVMLASFKDQPPQPSFQFRVRADGKINGIDGWDVRSRISLSSCIEFIHRLEYLKDQSTVTRPHSFENLFRNASSRVRSLDCGICIHHLAGGIDANGVETPDHIYIYVPMKQARNFSDLPSLIKIEQNASTAQTPLGFIASWNRQEEKATMLSMAAIANNSYQPAYQAIQDASKSAISRIYNQYIAGAHIPPSPAAAQLESTLRNICTPAGFSRLIEILRGGNLSTYELQTSSLLHYLELLPSYTGLFHDDASVIVRAIISILDNDDKIAEFLPIHSIPSPTSATSYFATSHTGGIAVVRRRRRSIDIKSLSARIRINVKHPEFERPYTVAVNPFICIQQLENAIYDRFVKNWFLLKKEDLTFHKKILKDRPLVFTTRTIDIIRFIGKNGNRLNDFVDPTKGHIMRICTVHNGTMSYGREIQNRVMCTLSLNEPAKALSSYFQIDLGISLIISGFKISAPQPNTNSVSGFPLYASHNPTQGFVQLQYHSTWCESSRHTDYFKITSWAIDERLPIDSSYPIRYRYLRFYAPEGISSEVPFALSISDLVLHGTVYDSFLPSASSPSMTTNLRQSIRRSVPTEYLRRMARGIQQTIRFTTVTGSGGGGGGGGGGSNQRSGRIASRQPPNPMLPSTSLESTESGGSATIRRPSAMYEDLRMLGLTGLDDIDNIHWPIHVDDIFTAPQAYHQASTASLIPTATTTISSNQGEFISGSGGGGGYRIPTSRIMHLFERDLGTLASAAVGSTTAAAAAAVAVQSVHDDLDEEAEEDDDDEEDDEEEEDEATDEDIDDPEFPPTMPTPVTDAPDSRGPAIRRNDPSRRVTGIAYSADQRRQRRQRFREAFPASYLSRIMGDEYDYQMFCDNGSSNLFGNEINRKSRALAPAFDPRPGRTNVGIYTDVPMETMVDDLSRTRELPPTSQRRRMDMYLSTRFGDSALRIPLTDPDRPLLFFVDSLIRAEQSTPDKVTAEYTRIWEDAVCIQYTLPTDSPSQTKLNAVSLNALVQDKSAAFNELIYVILRRVYSFVLSTTYAQREGWTDCFLSERLSRILDEQLKQALIVAGGCIPQPLVELVKQHPFLFSLTNRMNLVRAMGFGTTRSMIWLLGKSGDSADFNYSRSVGRLRHERFWVHRDPDLLLEQGSLVFEYHARHKSELEVLWHGEEGTGLGPTLEFYTLYSHELQRAKLGLWLSNVNGDSGGCVHPQNLFPAPYPKYMCLDMVNRYYHCIGVLLGKCLLDQRFCDLDLSIELVERFCPCVNDRQFNGEERISDVDDAIYRISRIDHAYASSLVKLKEQSMQTDIEQMCINFAYYPQSNSYGFTMCPISDEHPAEEIIRNETLDEYVVCLANFMLYDGVRAQIESLVEGLKQVLCVDLSVLEIFTPEDFLLAVCGERYPEWTRDELIACVDPKNGYNPDSAAFIYFLDAMMLMTPPERASVVQFITGSKALPIGGISALVPRLTVARKSNGGYPSVNTCNHFLKLPEYRSPEEVKDRLLSASLEKGFYFN
ncbi:hypothetical protein ACOME3_000339 [Neoechinorhynchus agilis]